MSSRASPRQPLSPRRVPGGSAGKDRSPEIMETLKSLQQIQEMIKTQEQIILNQSTLTSDNEGGVVENESSKVGVVKHGTSKEGNEREDIIVVDLESSFSDGMSSLKGSVLPRSIKGFGFSSPLEKGAVKIAPRLKYSPTTGEANSLSSLLPPLSPSLPPSLSLYSPLPSTCRQCRTFCTILYIHVHVYPVDCLAV